MNCTPRRLNSERASEVEIYVDPRSPNCVRVITVAEHLGCEVKFRHVDLVRGEHRSASFRSMNSMAQVPVLIDGDRVLTESHAIIQWLAERHGHTSLWPDDPWSRAQITKWMHWNAASLSPAVRTFQWENIFKPMMGAGEPDVELLARSEESLRALFTILERALGGGASDPEIGGQLPTLADYSVAATLMYAEPARLPIEGFNAIARWRAQIAMLPSWLAALSRTI